MNIVMADDSFNSSSFGHVIVDSTSASEDRTRLHEPPFFLYLYIYIYVFFEDLFLLIYLNFFGAFFLSHWTVGVSNNQQFQCREKGCYYCTLGYEWERMKTI